MAMMNHEEMMFEFQIFRVQVSFASKPRLFDVQLQPRDILIKAINEHPVGTLWGGVTWHIGNIESINSEGLFFRFGKTTKSTIEMFSNGQFQDQEFETSPYTNIILDTKYEIVAIAKKNKLAIEIKGIANQLARLLNLSKNVKENDAKIEIYEIQDPKDFVSYLKSAYLISSFSMTFSRPNAFDVNKDFHKPLQKMLEEINGKKGKVDIKGDNLKEENLEELAKSVASTGNNASARIKQDEISKSKIIHLKGKSVFIEFGSIDDVSQKRELLNKIREIYLNLRGKVL